MKKPSNIVTASKITYRCFSFNTITKENALTDTSVLDESKEFKLLAYQ